MTDDKCERCFSYIPPYGTRAALCAMRKLPIEKERADEFCGPDAKLFYERPNGDIPNC
jgi:hypothetical protein